MESPKIWMDEMTEPYTHPSPVAQAIPSLRTPLLADSVKRLRLDPNAKFLTAQEEAIRAAEDHKQMIKAWRRAQEKVTLKGVK